MTRAVLPARRWIADLAASTLLLAVPIAGFWPTFGGPSYLVAAIGGALLGLAIAAVGAWRRWGVLVLAAVTVLAYFGFGGALALSSTTIAGVIPTLETLRRLALGIVTSWKELLTTVTPVSASDGFALVPFLLSLIAAVVIASLALRASHPAWALLPAAAFLAGQIALGTSQPAAPVIEGVVFAVVAIVWLAVRQSWAPARAAVSLGENAAAPRPTRRILTGGAIIAVAVLAGVATSAFAAPNSPRYVLRDTIIPPFDIQQYPSPLQSYRGIVRDDASTSLFTVTGLPKDARVRIATMDAYTGIVYNVSDSGAGSSSAFSSLRSNMSGDAQGTAATM
ncbi:MAG: transglutaminase domain-containing protein, partial [Actinobacteria bacterium]|nr:transglutaminase domain-containing protein [Actinomycetota bacterium]